MTTQPNTPTAPALSLANIKSTNFAPENIAKAGEMMQAMATAGITQIIANGDWATTGNLPAGFGISIRPVSRTVETTAADGTKERVRENFAVLALAVPTVALLMQSDKGAEYVHNAVLRALEQKASNAVIRADDLSQVSLPYTVDEFITDASVGAQGMGLKTYTELAPALLKQLAAMQIKLDRAMLRMVLQSADFASKLMPNITQGFWEKVINSAKGVAVREGMPVTIFDNWLTSRNTTTAGAAQAYDENAEFTIG